MNYDALAGGQRDDCVRQQPEENENCVPRGMPTELPLQERSLAGPPHLTQYCGNMALCVTTRSRSPLHAPGETGMPVVLMVASSQNQMRLSIERTHNDNHDMRVGARMRLLLTADGDAVA